MVDVKDISQNLKTLGLDDQESVIYLALLNEGESSVYGLSKATNIPRTTVYRISERLIEKKFASKVIGAYGEIIRIRLPKDLDFLVEEKISDLESTEASLKALKDMTESLSSTLPKTQVRYYQGKEGIKQIMWNALKAKNETFGYSIFGRIEVVGKSFIEKYNHEFYSRKLKDRVIIGKAQLPRFKEFVTKGSLHKDSYNIRVVDNKHFYVSGDTLMYNNIYAVSFWKQGEIVGIEIENPEIVKVQRGIFETLWEIGKTVDSIKKIT